MQSGSSVKEEFLKKWINGLQTYDACKKEMTITERKNAIKLSADVAMASTTAAAARKSPAALWRHSVMAKSAPKLAAAVKTIKKCKRRCLMKRIRRPNSKGDYKYKARCTAKRLVKKRMTVLKGLIPGGECMEDDEILIKETLDYILALRVQVDVMRQLACATTQTQVSGSSLNS